MIDIELIAAMRGRGKSYGQIANRLGISPTMVKYYCGEHGISSPRDFIRPDRIYPPELDAVILQLRGEGKSMCAIGRIVGKHRGSIRSRLRVLRRREVMRLAA
jgi:DNA-directed RNA polymerase specialized sigma24 family protein